MRPAGTAVRARRPPCWAGPAAAACLLCAPAAAAARGGGALPDPTVVVSVAGVMSLQGWGTTTVDFQGGPEGTPGSSDFGSESGFGQGVYFAGYAGLDRHFQLGGFVTYANLGMVASRSEGGDAFYRGLELVGVGASLKGGDWIDPVVWLGAALDVGLGVLLPGNSALPRAGGGLELDNWYGVLLFPRIHLDAAVGDTGVGFFFDLGPLAVPYSAGTGSGRLYDVELGFSTWTICLQLLVGFSLGV